MASGLVQEVEAGALAFIAAEAKAQLAAIGAFIASGEARVKPALVAVFKNIPSVRGLAGSVANPIIGAVESGIEGYVDSLLAKYDGPTLAGYVVALLEHAAASVSAG